MTNYPDNVIPFPGLPRPVSAVTVADREIPDDIHRILSMEPSDSFYADTPKFLSFKELDDLDFPLMTKPEVHTESHELEQLLALMAEQLGEFKAKQLGEVIGSYVASVADMAYAEGLAEAIID